MGYPQAWEADVVLADGSVGHVRPIVPDDTAALHRFHAGQSEESIYLRFFASVPRLSDRDAHRFTHVDHRGRVALVMLVKDEIVGIGRYDRLEGLDGPTAEVAFNVADKHQGRGIGSVLLEHLADIGREAGVRRFVADVLPRNRRMINVFRDAGYDVSHEFDDGVIAVSFDIEPTDASRAVQLAREHRAEAVSMRRLLHPPSVAVVGVGRSPTSVGRALFRHIRESGFTGRLYAVNPATDEIDGHPVSRSLAEVGEPVGLAVIAVPASQVAGVVRECAAADVASAVVVSTGFGESGDGGEHLQAELLATARATGIRLLGPASFGLINLHPTVSLNASLSPRAPRTGSLGLFTQSGAVAITVLAAAEARGLGISTFASAGNRADVSGNDLMQYWIDDEATTAVGLYLESMGNPRKFSRIARQLASVKPVIVLTSGFPRYGAPKGHRVRSTRTRPEAFEAMLRQAGVIRVENTHQLFDVAQLLVHQPLPTGERIAVVTNSEALSALTADAALSWGLTIGRRAITVAPDATAGQFGAALDEALCDERVDSVAACFVPPVVTADHEVVAAVEQAAAAHAKPLVATFIAMRGVVGGGQLPTYSLPEDAVRALAAATRYAQWRARDRGQWVRPEGIDRRAAHNVVESLLAERPEGRRLGPEQEAELLGAYGIGVWPSREVSSAEQAAAAAVALGLPAVVKATSDAVRHQPGQLWVRTGLSTPQEVATAYRGLARVLAPLGTDGIAVQAMAPAGVPVEVSSQEDPLFGPVVAFGVAGAPVDLLGDVAYRFPPLTALDAADMVAAVRAAPMLDGYRGTMPVDLAALHDLIARVSVLADDLPEVASLQLNPVMAHQGGVAVLGAQVTIAPAPGRADTSRRMLSR